MTERWDERITTTWFGPKMPPLHAACVASWIASGRRAVIYSYRDSIEGLPPKAEIHDGSSVLGEEEIFFLRQSKAYAHFSDIFRMEILRRGLGVWCDADYMILRDFPEFDEIMIGLERSDWPCNAVMYMPPEHPIAVGVVENFRRKGLAEWTYVKPRAMKLLKSALGQGYTIADMPNGHWGRHALQYYIRKLRLWDKLQPQDRFFAEETYTGALFEPGDHSRISENPEVSGVHFFEKKKQDEAPAPGSFYAWAHARVAAYL